MRASHGILLVDKPSGMTSHDVVQRVRRALGTRHVGHAGTLDPLATGLLVLGVGEGRKVLRYLSLDDKRYEARVALGVQTDTLDADGAPEERAAVPADLDRQRVTEGCRAFVGVIRQRAPRFSALKRAGVPLHVRARRGEAVEAPEREVRVYAIEVVDVGATELVLAIHCGKGFYVRSLARDLGLVLGTRAHLGALRRTASGRFDVANALPLERLAAEASSALLSIAQALPDAPRVLLDAAGVEHALHGRAIPRAHALPAPALPDPGVEPILLCDAREHPVALGRAEEAAFRVVRGLNLAS